MQLKNLEQIQELKKTITNLSTQLSVAKKTVSQWIEANKCLSLNAAQERAKNQETGRGFMGSLLGSKFRSAMRASAAASNALLAKEVAEKRARIADGKRESQEYVRQIQEEIIAAKQQLALLKSTAKTKIKTSHSSLELLHKLKDATEAGLLTQEEFEEKRKKIISEL
ncbi:hypothetical protein [Nitrosomonas ureae]|uniref:Short C-terminal domain-containing protein n=1 Tax=Nitrosomonas ureae TaxID=44577 RepID=A0A1H9HK28_9PROT|nr:hypothetical protein [Nitrosomonas ureae]SEQ62616.1 hypothetical protein SAMN05421510_11153 [Nitrosomonas ureae]